MSPTDQVFLQFFYYSNVIIHSTAYVLQSEHLTTSNQFLPVTRMVTMFVEVLTSASTAGLVCRSVSNHPLFRKTFASR